MSAPCCGGPAWSPFRRRQSRPAAETSFATPFFSEPVIRRSHFGSWSGASAGAWFRPRPRERRWPIDDQPRRRPEHDTGRRRLASARASTGDQGRFYFLYQNVIRRRLWICQEQSSFNFENTIIVQGKSSWTSTKG